MKRLLFLALSVLALCILAQPARLQAQGKPKQMNASGTVKSVSANSLTIAAAGGKEMSFTIDSSTKFIGKGLSTKTARLGKLTAPDAVAMRMCRYVGSFRECRERDLNAHALTGKGF